MNRQETQTQNPSELAKMVLKVQSVAFGGDGIARQDGKVYFVEDTIPGDEVLAQITLDKGRYAKAQVQDIISPSLLRQKSPCPYDPSCGGCQWLQIDYQQQLEWKLHFVESALRRIGRLDQQDISIVGSPDHLRFRNRIHLKARWGQDGLLFGYNQRRTRQLVPIQSCLIGDQLFDQGLNILRELAGSRDDELYFKFEIQSVWDHQNQQRLSLVLIPSDLSQSELFRPLLDGLAKHEAFASAVLNSEADRAPYLIYDVDAAGRRYYTKPGLFQQVNLPANRLMRAYVHQKIRERSPRRILDCYCGSGNLSLGMINAEVYVEGSEFSTAAIACAQHNLQQNNLQGAAYFAGDSIKHLRTCADNKNHFDIIISDPPRQGMQNAIAPLLTLNPQTIIYVSCDPATLARDLGKLCRKKYRISEVKCFDFFPNTYHVETVVIIDRI